MQRYLVKKYQVYSNDPDYFTQMQPRENGAKRSGKWMKKIGERMKIFPIMKLDIKAKHSLHQLTKTAFTTQRCYVIPYEIRNSHFFASELHHGTKGLLCFETFTNSLTKHLIFFFLLS